MRHFEGNIDEGEPTPYIEESVSHTTTRSGKILPLETNDDPPLKSTDSPKRTLKPFPSELRNTFLGDDETWLVVIPSSLSKQQEGKLLDTLRKNIEDVK